MSNNKYLQSVKARGYTDLKPEKYPEDPSALIRQLIKEGDALLATEASNVDKPKPSKSLEIALGAKSDNAYVRARSKILSDLPLKVREELEQMEKSGKTNNPVYKKFVQSISTLGDKLSQ
jgi:hypothetical protein